MMNPRRQPDRLLGLIYGNEARLRFREATRNRKRASLRRSAFQSRASLTASLTCAPIASLLRRLLCCCIGLLRGAMAVAGLLLGLACACGGAGLPRSGGAGPLN